MLMQNNKSSLPGLTVRQPDCGLGLIGQVKMVDLYMIPMVFV